MTRPSISTPASANAALAATEPDAMQPSIPSFSMMVRKISIVDFGRSSSRTAGSNACCICTARDLSSASFQERQQCTQPTLSYTHAYRCPSLSAREWCELDLYVQPPILIVYSGFRLSGSISMPSSGCLSDDRVNGESRHCTSDFRSLSLNVCRPICLTEQPGFQVWSSVHIKTL